jgi:hypothetical protein
VVRFLLSGTLQQASTIRIEKRAGRRPRIKTVVERVVAGFE